MIGFFHTGITVRSLDRSLPFYRDVLGFSVVLGPTEYFEGEELSEGLGVPNSVLRLVVLQAGKDKLELLEYKSPGSPSENPPTPNTLGAMHVAFRVEDADAVMKRLREKGVPFVSNLNRVTEGALKGWNWVYFKDPDGIVLELVQIDE